MSDSKGGRPKKLVLPITLTPSQKAVHASTARHRIIKAGRRFGKSYYAAYWLMKRALENPGRHWVCARTSGLAVDEFWSRWQNWLPAEYVVGQDKSRHRIFLQVGNMKSELGCASAERQDNLRGRGLSSLVLDEASFVTSTLYNTILAPMLLDHAAPSLIISSPKTSWFTKQWDMVNKGDLKDWESWHYTIWDNAVSRGGIIPDEDIAALEKSTPQHIWLSEFMAEQSDDTGLVYGNFSEANVYDPAKRFQDVKQWPVQIAIDWGKRDDTGVSWLSISPEGYVVISEEHSQSGWAVSKHAGVMQQVSDGFEQLKDTDYVLSHDGFRKYNSSTESIAEDFKRNGMTCKPSTRDLVATIDKVRSFVSGNDGIPWLYVSAKCQTTIKAFEAWQFRDHEIDILQALRYGLAEICRKKMTPFARMIARDIRDKGSLSDFDSQVPDRHALTLERPKRRRGGQFGWDGDNGVPI